MDAGEEPEEDSDEADPVDEDELSALAAGFPAASPPEAEPEPLSEAEDAAAFASDRASLR